MSNDSKSEKTLITTYLSETEKVLKETLTPAEQSTIMAKLKKRWSFLHVRANFDEFLKSYHLKSLAASELYEVKRFMTEVFPTEPVVIAPNEKEGTLTVSVELEEGKLEGKFVVEPEEAAENTPKFEPFTVCLTGDPGVVWIFARTENLSEPEARMALNSIEETFWLSKKGLKLMKLSQRTFEVFVENVPAGLLKSKGLKRHYKIPSIVTAVDKDGALPFIKI